MRKIKYKEISPELKQMAQPYTGSARASVGMEGNIGEFYYLSIDDLIPYSKQARKIFSEEQIESLASSIKEHGIRQPLTVIASESQRGKYEVISGERRLRAARLIELKKIPCIILKESERIEEIAIIENIHRENLHPVELGNAYSELLDKNYFKNQSELSQKLSIAQSSLSEHLKYAKFDEDIKEFLIVHNIKSRDILRKLSRAESKEAQEVILGITKKSKKRNLSILRISIEDGSMKFQTNGINKLNLREKENLKLELQAILDDL